jgi:hypothetical protein
MQFFSFRGAMTVAAMIVTSLLGTAPSAAWAHGSAAAVAAPQPLGAIPVNAVSAGAQPMAASPAAVTPAPAPTTGSAWIAPGTVLDPNARPVAQTAPAPGPIALALATGTLHVASLSELVGDMPVAGDTALAPDMKCLAQAVYFEARGEPIEGQLAVAEVVINRARSAQYPDSYCDVITQPAQFSFVRRGRIPSADESSEAWRRAVAIAEIAQNSLWRSRAEGAMYFHATYVNPTWAHQKVELAQIDTHIFYR